MKDFKYYVAPNDEIFNNIKASSIKIWETYDDTFGYASNKIDNIKNINNIKDNALYIVGMFDINNRWKLFDILDCQSKVWLQRIWR